MEQSYSHAVFRLLSGGRGRREGQWWVALGWVHGGDECTPQSPALLPLRVWLLINDLSFMQQEDGLGWNKWGTAPWKTWWECNVSWEMTWWSQGAAPPALGWSCGCWLGPAVPHWAGACSAPQALPHQGTCSRISLINVPNRNKTNGKFFLDYTIHS